MKKIIKFLMYTIVITLVFNVVMQKSINVQAAEDTSWIRGVNIPSIWYDSESYDALDKIKSESFNTVRIVWSTKGTSDRLDEILEKCEKLELKPIVELHDVTGETSRSSLNDCVDYWTRSDVMQVMQKHETAWLNIANEWGSADSWFWKSAYKSAVKKIRKAGYAGAIIIDAGGWGQDDKNIIKYAKDIMDVDSENNTIFSIHMYGSWNDNYNIKTFFEECKSKDIPIIVGEFGYNSNNGNNNLGCKVDVEYLMNYCKENKIGFISWSWCGNNDENKWLDMTNNWGEYTWWGSFIKNNMW